MPTGAQVPNGQPFGFAGEQRDANGLVYLRARKHGPQIERFLQPDTLAKGAPGSRVPNLHDRCPHRAERT